MLLPHATISSPPRLLLRLALLPLLLVAILWTGWLLLASRKRQLSKEKQESETAMLEAVRDETTKALKQASFSLLWYRRLLSFVTHSFGEIGEKFRRILHWIFFCSA